MCPSKRLGILLQQDIIQLTLFLALLHGIQMHDRDHSNLLSGLLGKSVTNQVSQSGPTPALEIAQKPGLLVHILSKRTIYPEAKVLFRVTLYV